MFNNYEKSDIAWMLCIILIWGVPITTIGILIINNSLTLIGVMFGSICLISGPLGMAIVFIIIHMKLENARSNAIINILNNLGNTGLMFQTPPIAVSAAC